VLLFGLVLPSTLLGQQIQGYVQSSESGRIDWFNRTVEARGTVSGSHGAEAAKRDLAVIERKARISARRSLFSILGGVRIQSGLLVRDVLEREQATRDKLLGMIHNALLLDRTRLPDGGAEVRLGLRMDERFGRLLIPEKAWFRTSEDPGANATEQLFANATRPEGMQETLYTGLVVDARGLSARPAMVFRLRTVGDRLVYGPQEVDSQVAASRGMALYVEDLNSAVACERSGGRPLMVRAAGLWRDSVSDLRLERRRAAKVLRANAASDFLSQCRVVVVLGPSGDSEMEEYPLSD
jgi:hypothetical protein